MSTKTHLTIKVDVRVRWWASAAVYVLRYLPLQELSDKSKVWIARTLSKGVHFRLPGGQWRACG